MERRLAAILAADMVGYSRLMATDEAGTLRRHKAHHSELIDPKITEYGGRVVKTTGDGVLVEFPSVVGALRCAVTIQLAMPEREGAVPEEKRIAYRIGINLGDIIVEDNDIYGDGVNVTARLEAMAEPGGICVSRTVVDHVKGKVSSDFDDLGEQSVKNIPEPVHVFRVLMMPEEAGEAVVEPKPLPQQAPSIAVLAFKNLSGDPAQTYFADAVAEDITTELSRFQDLFVISRESAFHYRDQAKTAKTIAEELGVTYLLEGSVQRAGERLRVNIQLIEAETERHLWAERYDRVVTDLFAIQDQIVEAVVSTLGETIWRSAAAELKRKPIENFHAYDYVLRGKDLLHRFHKQANSEARALLTKAIELDPKISSAYILLAWTHILGYVHRFDDTDSAALNRASEETQKAAALDGNSYAIHRLHSRIALARGDHDTAMAHIERAVELNSNDGDIHANYALLLCVMGCLSKAHQRIDEAIRRNPHHPSYYGSILARINYLEGRDDKALAVLKMVDPLTIVDHVVFAGSYAQLGRADEARRHAEEILAINPSFSTSAYLATVSYRRDVDRDRVADGLGKAGLPK